MYLFWGGITDIFHVRTTSAPRTAIRRRWKKEEKNIWIHFDAAYEGTVFVFVLPGDGEVDLSHEAPRPVSNI